MGGGACLGRSDLSDPPSRFVSGGALRRGAWDGLGHCNFDFEMNKHGQSTHWGDQIKARCTDLAPSGPPGVLVAGVDDEEEATEGRHAWPCPNV